MQNLCFIAVYHKPALQRFELQSFRIKVLIYFQKKFKVTTNE